jgi:hypothetical protein
MATRLDFICFGYEKDITSAIGTCEVMHNWKKCHDKASSVRPTIIYLHNNCHFAVARARVWVFVSTNQIAAAFLAFQPEFRISVRD